MKEIGRIIMRLEKANLFMHQEMSTMVIGIVIGPSATESTKAKTEDNIRVIGKMTFNTGKVLSSGMMGLASMGST